MKRLGNLSISERLQKDKMKAEHDLVETTQLLGVLKKTIPLLDGDPKIEGEELQTKYSHLRVDLNGLRSKSATLSSQKVNVITQYNSI
jgi:hypothetical protein